MLQIKGLTEISSSLQFDSFFEAMLDWSFSIIGSIKRLIRFVIEICCVVWSADENTDWHLIEKLATNLI